ncbi:MAG: S1/P1 Nuclease [Balneolaceae bacterium]|nr:MAG: S1/P1 Nuclease [Balneolaceae bacterium]
MKLLLLFIGFTLISHTGLESEKWGQVGHYVTGEIAEYHLTDTARERVNEILGDKSMALATVWMDDIRSDSRYDHTTTWHWATIPDGMTYEEAEQEETGDIIWALETLIAELKQGELSETEEREKLKMVMHMIGDIHQPLHVGTGEDRGGNDVRVQWMGNNSNLHRVWDSDIINSIQMSFTELARELNTATAEQVAEWQKATVRDWAYESVSYRDRIYDLPDDLRIGFDYRYQNKEIVFKRLLQAGVRMAGVLNEIYDN